MKRNFILCFAAIAVFVSSCNKEIISGSENSECEKELNFVDMTFTAQSGEEISSDTRAQFGSNYPAIEWVEKDKVAVIGTKNPSTVCEFSALSSAVSTTLSGKAVEGETQFVALYPYQDNLTYQLETITTTTTTTTTHTIHGVDLPAVQTAVAGSFDPKAFLFTSLSDGETMKFYPSVALVKFKLVDKNAGNIKSITLKNNGTDALAFDDAVVQVGSNYSVFGWRSGESKNASTSVKLVPESGGAFVNGENYYFVIRPVACSSGVSVSVEYNDGTVISKISTNAFKPDKTKVLTLPDIPVGFTYSEAFELGYDVIVGGKGYNKNNTTTYSSLNATSEAVNLNDAAYKAGLYFLKGDKFTLSNSWNVANDVVLIGDTDGAKFNGDTKYNIYHYSKSLRIKNIDFNIPNTNYFIINNNTSTDAEALVFDGCKISTKCPLLYSYLKTANTVQNTCAVKNLILKDCDITLTGSANHIVNLGNAKASKIETVNISGCTITPSVAARVISLPAWAEGSTTNPALVFSNNTLNNFTPSTAIISCGGAMQSITAIDNTGSVSVLNGTSYFINNVQDQQNISFDNSDISYTKSSSATSAVSMYDYKGGNVIFTQN